MRCAPGRPGDLEVRRPQAVRPWQHVLEPLAGYLTLAQGLWERPALAGAYNFGPDASEAVTVREVVELARAAYGDGEVHYGDGTEGPQESAWLALDVAKAQRVLGVHAGTDAGGSDQADDGLVPRAERQGGCTRVVPCGYCRFRAEGDGQVHSDTLARRFNRRRSQDGRLAALDAKNAIYTDPLGKRISDRPRPARRSARHVRSRVLRAGICCLGPRDVFVQANISTMSRRARCAGCIFSVSRMPR